MFKSSSNRIEEFFEFRSPKKETISFGNQFLDDCLDGIHRDDLIVTTARTGGGKTELITQIAMNASAEGKNVYLFALEAHKNEIESRMLFKKLAQLFFDQPEYGRHRDRPNYQKFLYGQQQEILGPFEDQAKEEIKSMHKTLFTFYRGKDFSVDTFEAEMCKIGEAADLVILDHLHYLDFDEDNENFGMKKTVKAIRQISQFYRKPVILVAHIRKTDKRLKALIPDTEDLHGSSDIAKIANKIIATAPAYDQGITENYISPTYFRVTKNRTDGMRCRFIGLCGFDFQKNKYVKKYRLGLLESAETKFKELARIDYPQWAAGCD